MDENVLKSADRQRCDPAARASRDQAHLENAKIDLDRYTKLAQQKSIATQTADSQKAIVDQLVAMIKSDEAIIESARVNLGYTNLTSRSL